MARPQPALLTESAMRLPCVSLLVGLALLAAAPPREAVAQHHDADARLRRIYATEWRWRQEQFPDGEDSARPLEAHLPMVDPVSQQMRLRVWESVLARLDAISPKDLSAAERLNYEVYRPEIETLVANQRFRDYEMPANADTTFWSDLGYTARRPFRSVVDYRHWISQMQDIPRYFQQQIEEMRAGLKRGFTPPQVTLAGRDASLTAVTDVPAEESLFYAPFKEMPGIGEKDRQALREQALETIRSVVQPAHAELLRFWRTEYVPGARTTLAAQSLPDGAAYYRAKIREFTTLDMDAADIHQFGLTEVARLHEEMLAAMKETGFDGDFPAFLDFLRTDPRFFATTADELLMRAAWIAKRFDGKASQYFGYLPRARFGIRPVPAELAPFYTAGRGGAGVYLLNTYDLPSRPLYNLTALTLHESAPGHAFQGPIALEHKGQPEFRQHTYLSAYGEGWALYCERLGVEMGMYETPYDRFGMLGYQIWRAARLVVDTGIHAEGWSRDRAIAYLHEYTALPDHEIATEVDRYISWPAQALSYYLGEAAILRLRAEAERSLGPAFNIRAFHDAVLELGSVPLPVLESRIERFIAAGGKGPYPDLE
jgi:uncharacterized protein (DUF885 family)